MPRTATLLILLGLTVFATGCKSAYYRAWETFGVEKRDILVDRVEEAQDAQGEAVEEFQTTYERFTALTGFDGGDLEDAYDRLQDALERAEERAETVSDKIDDVESVANDLFSEWEDELDQYTDPNLRASSEQQLDDTRDRFDQMLASMEQAESRMEPVLARFRDSVLALKHNLNAQAIGALTDVASEIDTEVAQLIADMQASIAEADAFLSGLE